MKLFGLVVTLFFGIFLSIAVVFSASFAILNSIGHECDEHGHCTEVCDYEGLQLPPGSADFNTSLCVAVFCSADFTVTVHTCHYEERADCTYMHNFKIPYPECCNQFCTSITQLD